MCRAHSERDEISMRKDMAAKGKQENGVGNPAIERETQVITCPTLLPTIKTYL
jgi:hypothetical protein